MDNSSLVWFIVAGVFFIWFLTRSKGGLPLAELIEKVKNGAVIVDVRSPSEFASGHLDGAVNLPLEQIDQKVGSTLPDKSPEVLCYCQSGMRSSMASAKLKKMGYDSFNLGSLGRARQVASKAASL